MPGLCREVVEEGEGRWVGERRGGRAGRNSSLSMEHGIDQPAAEEVCVKGTWNERLWRWRGRVVTESRRDTRI